MSATSFSTQDASAGIMAALTKSDAPRAVLVSLNRDGQLELVPVGDAQSLVNIKDELIDHLNSYPHSDEWLVGLRDYCDGRLAERAIASETGGLSLPTKDGGWNVIQTSTQGRA
jgi:hypothetical protein